LSDSRYPQWVGRIVPNPPPPARLGRLNSNGPNCSQAATNFPNHSPANLCTHRVSAVKFGAPASWEPPSVMGPGNQPQPSTCNPRFRLSRAAPIAALRLFDTSHNRLAQTRSIFLSSIFLSQNFSVSSLSVRFRLCSSADDPPHP
jgi:hypothetical protein